MNLQEFTKNALVEIVSGIGGARAEAAKHGATVGITKAYMSTKDAGVLSDPNGGMMTLVEFDIALAEASGKGAKASIGVLLEPAGKGSPGAEAEAGDAHSRLRFSVPIVFPGMG